jgi:putative sigma-54 modulation protein
MTVNVHSVHFDADAKLLEHIDKKIGKLATHHDRIIAVDVFLKLDNVMHQIKDKIAEIRVQIPKHELFVKQSSKSFEESFDMAMDSMLIQIKKVKEKQPV